MDHFNDFLNSSLQVSDFNIVPLAGDASTRRYYRVISDKKSWVLMDWEPFDNPSDFAFLSVQKYFDSNHIRVPKILNFSAEKGLFLLEDLGDLTLERKFWEFQNQKTVLPFYEKALDELIKIHQLIFADNRSKSCTAYDIEFSVEKLLWEMNYARKHLLKGLLNISLTATQEAALEEEFRNLCSELYALKQVICHRDFHSRNVMLHYNDVILIDFQDARLGPPVYDLVSLFYDSYVKLNDESVDHLIDYYIKNFSYFDRLELNKSQFLDALLKQRLQRCFKACGSFASFKITRDDDRYLHYIAPTLTHLLEALTQYQKLPLLEELLLHSKPDWEKL